jgi:DNA-binding GntR family transcriptional regulator
LAQVGIAVSDLEPPLDEQAYRRLRQALVEGVFAPGERLSIRRLAAALGTSTMPARTALRRLASEQALDLMPSGTAIVPRLTRAAFTELTDMRIALETLALQRAGPLMDAPQYAALTALVAAGHAARLDGNAEAFLRADREFLSTIYRNAGAPMLLGVIEALWLRRGPLFWEARWLLLGRRDGAERHAEILDALQAGDSAKAKAELRLEIESARDFLLQELRFADDVPVRSRLAALTPRRMVKDKGSALDPLKDSRPLETYD